MVKKLTILKALEPFLSQPKESLHLAYLAKELKEPHPTVRLWLRWLEKAGVLKKQVKGRLSLYALNHKHQNIIDYVAIAEKNRVIQKCEKELLLREVIGFMRDNIEENTKAILFGSAMESTQKANDIDLLLTGKIDKEKVKAFSKKINKELHVISVKDLQSVSPALRSEIIKKHLIINGSEEIVRWLLW